MVGKADAAHMDGNAIMNPAAGGSSGYVSGKERGQNMQVAGGPSNPRMK